MSHLIFLTIKSNWQAIGKPRSLKCSYLDRTPIRPREENWFALGGIGGSPLLCSEEFGDLDSGEGKLWLLSDALLWKDVVVGGGGKATSSAGSSAPSSTHLLSFSS